MHLLIQNYIHNLDNNRSRTSLFTLLVIFALGFLLRFWYVSAGHAYHYLAINDELTAYEYAMRFLAGDTTTYYLGQPDFAGGKAPGPYFTLYWVLTYYLGGKSPEGALLIVSLFTSAVIFLIYRFASYFMSNRQALLVSLLFASAPWTVYYAVGLWNPIPLVILGVLLFMSLWNTVCNNNSKAVFIVCILMAIIPHFHMIGLFYIPAVLLVFYAMPTRINKRWFLAGVITGIALYLPYFIGEAANNWQNLQAILAGDSRNEFSFSVLKILTAPAAVLSNIPSRWVGPEFHQYIEFGDIYFGSYLVLILINLVSIFFSLYVIYTFFSSFISAFKTNNFSIKKTFRDNQIVTFLTIMIFVPLILFLPTGHNYATRYTIIIFPLLFVILGMRLLLLTQTRFKKVIINSIAVFIIFNIYLNIAFSLHTNRMFEAEKDFMPSFKNLEEIRRELASSVNGIPVITLSPEIEKITELERTLLSALPQYLDIHYRYVEITENRSLKPMTLLLSKMASNSKKTIYEGNGIILVNSND